MEKIDSTERAAETEAPYAKCHKENRSFFRRLSVANALKNAGRFLRDQQAVLSLCLEHILRAPKYRQINDSTNRNKTKVQCLICSAVRSTDKHMEGMRLTECLC